MKQTEIGIIPDDWRVINLGEVGTVKMCKRVMKEQTSEYGEIPFYKIGTFGKSPDAFISKKLYTYLKENYSFPKKGDVLISAAGTIGRTVIYDGKEAFFQDSNIVWLDNDETVISNKYLYYLYQIIQWKTENGGVVSRLYNDIFNSTKVPLPPTVEEQQKIAEVLGNIDNTINALEKLITKKKNIKQAAMQQLLAGTKRLPGFASSAATKQTPIGQIPADWEVININKCCTIKARIGWQGLKSNEYLNTGKYVLITGIDFDNGFINWKLCNYVTKWRFEQDKNIQIRQGDILITKDGTIGKVAFLNKIPMQGTLNSGIFVIRPRNLNKIDTVFLSLVFKSFWFDNFLEQIMSGSTIVHLYQKDFVKFNFPVPCIKEQTAIAEVLSDMDSEISALDQKLSKYKNLKAAMASQLLTGRIRLV